MIILTNILLVLTIAVQDSIPPVDTTSKPFIEVVHKKAEPFMIKQVSHLSDFVHLFNGNKNDSLSDKQAFRVNEISQLFDFETLKIENSTLNKNVPLFLEDICNTTQNFKLAYPPKDFAAKVTIGVNYHSKPQTITCYLNLRQHKKGYSWFITDLYLPFLEQEKVATISSFEGKDSSIYISPNTFETQFLDLYNLIKQRKDLLKCFKIASNANSDIVNTFREKVKNGEIKPLYTEKTELFLKTEPQWVIKLNFINRKTDNSGWLMTDLFLLPVELNRLKSIFPTYE